MTPSRRPPGPSTFLGIGNYRHLKADALQWMTEAGNYGPLAYVPILWEPYCLVRDPELIQQALAQGHTKMRKDRFTHALSRVMGDGLISSEGELWRKQRRLVSHAFTPKRIRSYGAAMVDAAVRTLDDWEDGQEIDVHLAMTELTLDVVGRTLFDADVRDSAKEVGDALTDISDFYATMMESPLPLPEWWPSSRNKNLRKAVQNVDRIIQRIIEQRRASVRDRGDLLSALLQAQDDEGGGMSDRQLRDECVTLFLAGHETTSIALSNSFFLLSQHPEIEARVHEEVRDVLGSRRPTSDHAKSLVFTECIIKESMRLYPPVYAIGRLLLEDFELGGYVIEKGVTLLFSQWVTHRRPECFPNPLRFDPERWLPERAKSIHKYSYFPFGGGPRICIGNHFAMMEAILLMASLVQRFRLELVPGETLELLPAVTLRPARGLRMRLHARPSDSAQAA